MTSMSATARRCRSAGTTHTPRATQSTVTSTKIVRNDNCDQRRWGVNMRRSLAMSFGMRQAWATGKGGCEFRGRSPPTPMEPFAIAWAVNFIVTVG